MLEDYGVRGRIAEIRPGPVVTLYELEPAPGTKSSRVIGLPDDIARSMSVIAVRIATVPGRNVIGIEMPNTKRETVYLSEMFVDEGWARKRLRLGELEIEGAIACPRCVMVTHGFADLPKDPAILRAIVRDANQNVGLYAKPAGTARVRLGDEVALLD